jgi:hypothetical protein
MIINHASFNAIATVPYSLVHVITSILHFDNGTSLMITTWLLVETHRGMKVLNQLDSIAHFISCTRGSHKIRFPILLPPNNLT